MITLVQLPRLDRSQQSSAWFGALDRAGIAVRVDPIERQALPRWIARAARGAGPARRRRRRRASARWRSSPTGSKATCSPRTRRSRSSRCSTRPARSAFEQIETAVLNVARYDVFRLGEAVLAGQAARALRMLDGLRRPRARRAVLVHWTLAEDIRALKRVKDALGAGKPLPLALREARVWGAKERVFERAVTLDRRVARSPTCCDAAHVCDGLVKGLKHPDWPLDPWEGLQRLVLMLAEQTARVGNRPLARLALTA